MTMNLQQRLSMINLSSADQSSASGVLYSIYNELYPMEDGMVQHAVSSSDLQALFSVWDRLDEDGQEVAGQILNLIIRKCSAHFTFTHFILDLVSALNSGPSKLKELILSSMARCIEENSGLIRDLSPDVSSSLCLAAAKCFADVHPSVGDSARQLMLAIAKCPDGVPIIFSNRSAVNVLQSMLDHSASMRIRLYDMVGSLSTLSDDHLKFCLEEGFMDALLEDIQSDDLLQKINVMEVLTDLAIQSPALLEHMHNLGVIKILQEMIVTSGQDPDGGLLHHAVIKFFGCFARVFPKQCLDIYPEFLNLIFSYINMYKELNVALRLLGFDTLSMIGYTAEGKRILREKSKEMKECLVCFGSAIKNGPLEVKVRHIDALRDLFTIEVLSDVEEFSDLVEKWWQWVYEDRTSEVFFGILKQPLSVMQLSVFRLFHAVATFSWFPVEVNKVEGFVEWLVKREKYIPDILHAKFELIQQITFNPASKEKIDPREQMRLMEYVRRGPFYSTGVVDVATK